MLDRTSSDPLVPDHILQVGHGLWASEAMLSAGELACSPHSVPTPSAASIGATSAGCSRRDSSWAVSVSEYPPEVKSVTSFRGGANSRRAHGPAVADASRCRRRLRLARIPHSGRPPAFNSVAIGRRALWHA